MKHTRVFATPLVCTRCSCRGAHENRTITMCAGQTLTRPHPLVDPPLAGPPNHFSRLDNDAERDGGVFRARDLAEASHQVVTT